jgi:hypothetical protein
MTLAEQFVFWFEAHKYELIDTQGNALNEFMRALDPDMRATHHKEANCVTQQFHDGSRAIFDLDVQYGAAHLIH